MSNKHSSYTPKFEELSNKYGLKLGGKWNIRDVPNHIGRHTNAYHEFVLKRVQSIDVVAAGNQDKFLKYFNMLSDYIVNHPAIMYN